MTWEFKDEICNRDIIDEYEERNHIYDDENLKNKRILNVNDIVAKFKLGELEIIKKCFIKWRNKESGVILNYNWINIIYFFELIKEEVVGPFLIIAPLSEIPNI